MKHTKKMTGILMLAILLAFGVLAVSEKAQAADKKLTLNGGKLTMAVGQQKSLGLIEADGDIHESELSEGKFKSSNAKVASVREGGDEAIILKAEKPGTAVVTVKYGNKKYTCKVTVIKKFALANAKGKNASDVAVLKKIVKKYYKKGMSLDLNDKTVYRWDKKRLAYIRWEWLDLEGSLSLNELTELKEVYCLNTNLKSLDVSGCGKLEFLSCGSSLENLKVGQCKSIYCGENALTSLDLSQCTNLESLDCRFNKLTSLDLRNCTKLKYLTCDNNMLTSLDLSPCSSLTSIECGNNQISSLIVNEKMEQLTCYQNQLTSLDLSRCTALTLLNCHENQITSLDLSNCPKLDKEYGVWCDDGVDVKWHGSDD